MRSRERGSSLPQTSPRSGIYRQLVVGPSRAHYWSFSIFVSLPLPNAWNSRCKRWKQRGGRTTMEFLLESHSISETYEERFLETFSLQSSAHSPQKTNSDFRMLYTSSSPLPTRFSPSSISATRDEISTLRFLQPPTIISPFSTPTADSDSVFPCCQTHAALWSVCADHGPSAPVAGCGWNPNLGCLFGRS